jgi:putative tryptophan/tyrosine transport system substrate-binding protein
MRRRVFIKLIGGAAANWSLATRAQEPGRIYRLGMITGAPRASPRMVAFFDELKVLGFVDGQNLKIEAGGFDLSESQFADVAATLARERPDVVFCVSDTATRAALEVARATPIVALSVDLVAAGFAHSLAHPGGNVTGVSIFAPELNGKRQEILMDAVPNPRLMAALADPSSTPAEELRALQNAARSRGVELLVFTAGVRDEIAPAIDKAKASGAGALNVLTAPLFSFNRRIVIEQAALQRLPAIYEWPEMAEDGGLIGYGPRLTLIYRQLARLVGKVLHGAKPENLPGEQPTNFDLVINLKTAKALGITLPEALLLRADKVIE